MGSRKAPNVTPLDAITTQSSRSQFYNGYIDLRTDKCRTHQFGCIPALVCVRSEQCYCIPQHCCSRDIVLGA